ncbi:hypothetical protein ACH5RR_002381 [Cinchona calisaya]|uniref:Uncharacterized protein n=1 Tax=Cinchona calisaya TaxID=153742 RepID=A0ABD3B6P3_9GENT
MADRSTISDEYFDDYDVIVVDDLSDTWEVINPSSSDDDEEDELDDFSFTEEEEEGDATAEVSFLLNKEEGPVEEFISPFPDNSIDSLEVADGNHDDEYDKKDEDGEDDDDEYDEGYDLDDELMPWGLSNKFGKQRIKKLGKRACSKMNKSKRLVCRYNKPGCVYGKHGFGVQYSYI